jgi:GrpB-like predicted nucleotidyltransferase (UPF0157 family)
LTDQNNFTWITEIHLDGYDPEWPKQFRAEAEKLSELLGDTALGIHHIGSTAVPGLAAKPVVDLMVEVTNLETIQSMTGEFNKAGYEVLGESGIPGRHFVTRNSDGVRTHDIHIFQTGHTEIEQMILFRDRMRENPSEAEAYSIMKYELANQYRHDPIRYTQEKSEFIMNSIKAQKEHLTGAGN